MKEYIGICMEMISDSVKSIIKLSKTGKNKKRLKAELNFMFTDKSNLSFGFICDTIGENPETWRTEIAKKIGKSKKQICDELEK
jgi:hypothetical protein